MTYLKTSCLCSYHSLFYDLPRNIMPVQLSFTVLWRTWKHHACAVIIHCSMTYLETSCLCSLSFTVLWPTRKHHACAVIIHCSVTYPETSCLCSYHSLFCDQPGNIMPVQLSFTVLWPTWKHHACAVIIHCSVTYLETSRLCSYHSLFCDLPGNIMLVQLSFTVLWPTQKKKHVCIAKYSFIHWSVTSLETWRLYNYSLIVLWRTGKDHTCIIIHAFFYYVAETSCRYNDSFTVLLYIYGEIDR